jgi:hypothetical protein
MTKETIEWYTTEEQKPPFQPGTNLIAIMADGRFVADLKWMGAIFAGPERNSMTWMPIPVENIRLWAEMPTGGDHLIVVPDLRVNRRLN